jgi:hypothetical protein
MHIQHEQKLNPTNFLKICFLEDPSNNNYLLIVYSGSIACAYAVSILRCAVAIGEGSSRLGLLSGDPLLSLFDMLLARGGGSGT